MCYVLEKRVVLHMLCYVPEKRVVLQMLCYVPEKRVVLQMCRNCRPQREHVRLFDVTERTSKARHKTGRSCIKCNAGLYDTIVHFGEKGGLKAPYRWKEAARAAKRADLIVCLGSSLKVLKCYGCLWRMDVRPEQRPKLAIVNLQWTPKDDSATLKIHGTSFYTVILYLYAQDTWSVFLNCLTILFSLPILYL